MSEPGFSLVTLTQMALRVAGGSISDYPEMLDGIAGFRHEKGVAAFERQKDSPRAFNVEQGGG